VRLVMNARRSITGSHRPPDLTRDMRFYRIHRAISSVVISNRRWSRTAGAMSRILSRISASTDSGCFSCVTNGDASHRRAEGARQALEDPIQDSSSLPLASGHESLNRAAAPPTRVASDYHAPTVLSGNASYAGGHWFKSDIVRQIATEDSRVPRF
jgi:hypothetical protein